MKRDSQRKSVVGGCGWAVPSASGWRQPRQYIAHNRVASVWRLASRDASIGWSDTQRSANLQRVVNNARFLILPWVMRKGLASKVLTTAARRLPADWQQRYGYRPVLLETFVQTNRHKGTCYRAANRIHVGQTVGRGKKALTHQQTLPIKDVWLYPLRRDYGAQLRL